MKNQLIAALLISSAVFAAPAFAAGNANLGNDVQNWAGPSVATRAQVRDQLIASEKANQYSHASDISYPVLAENGPTKTRAQVKQELADASAKGELNAYDNISYPSRPAYAAAQQAAPSVQTMVAQGNGLPAHSNP